MNGDNFMATMIQMAADIAKIRDRLAPSDQIFQTVQFNGAAAGSEPVIMRVGAGFNKIEHALISGRVYVYFGADGANTLVLPDYVLDANVPGPIHFPMQQHRTIAFAVAPTSSAVRGKIHVQNY